MLSDLLGEFMGTLMLVLMGDGVVANVPRDRSRAEARVVRWEASR